MKIMQGYHPGAMTAADRRTENAHAGMFVAGMAWASLFWLAAWLIAK